MHLAVCAPTGGISPNSPAALLGFFFFNIVDHLWVGKLEGCPMLPTSQLLNCMDG